MLAILCSGWPAGAAVLTGYRHVAWPMGSGAPSRINALAQSRDGFLWIGSVEGLFRFDGVAFETIAARRPGGARLVVSDVLAGRDGAVWVGLARGGGVAVYRHGRLVDAAMPNPSREVNDIQQDRDGAIWVARGGRRTNTLARFDRGRWREYGADAGLPEGQVWQIVFTRDGTMLVVLSDRIAIRRPGATRFAATGIAVTPRAALAQDAGGRIWLSDARGTRILRPDGGRAAATATAHYPHPGTVAGVRMMFDRAGQLWGTTWNDGVFRIARPGTAAGTTATFAAADGLTSDQTHALLQDREGNVWIGSELGLDLVRPTDLTIEPAIAANSPTSYRMATAIDGTVHVATATTLYAIPANAPPRPALRTASPAEALCAARAGGVWMILADRILRVAPGGVVRVPKPPGVTAYGCAEDRAGRLWLPALDRGLFWREAGRWRRIATGSPADAAIDPAGRAVILFRARPPTDPAGRFTAIHNDALRIGGIEGLLPAGPHLFVSGASGFARLAATGTRRLPGDRFPWLVSVNGLVRTPAGESWTIGDAGIVRMASADLNRAFDDPRARLPHRQYDYRDGLNSFAQKAPGQQAAVGADGRLWFLTRRNVIRIDPLRRPRNAVPPPVAIRALSTGGRVRRDPAGPLDLPVGTRQVAIAYSALSLSAPDRVRFRYRLSGGDGGWIDPGQRRDVTFADLTPGSYRFQVVAANDDGVWNRTGASVAFAIPPAFHETSGFRALGAAALLLLLLSLYRLRLRQVSRRIRERLEARVQERERIARDLHDTLLQGVQGLILRFQSVADQMVATSVARPVMEAALDRAEEMLVEGRDRLHDLRKVDQDDLEVALADMARAQSHARDPAVVTVHGPSRPIVPSVMAEIVCIVGEALFNVDRHARAERTTIRVDFARQRLTLVIEDDGVGFSPDAVTGEHYGLVGMRERANRVRGTLSIDSAPGRGTRIELCVPAALAYRHRPRRLRLPWPRR